MKPSILFVSTSSNWPLTDGKRQRTWFLIEALSKKFKVDLLFIGYQGEKEQIEKSNNSINSLFFYDLSNSNFPDVGYPNFLISRKQKGKNNFISNQIKNLFSELNNKYQYSFVFSRYLWPLMILSLPKETKVVCDIDDVYFEAQKSRIQKETIFLRKLKLQILFFLGTQKVKKLLNRIDTSIIVKESDRSFFGLKKAVCLPNLPFGFYIDKGILPNENLIINPLVSPKFGFIGKLSYRPNYQGLIDFINRVWNPLLKNKSDVRLVIAGSGEIPEILQTAISSSKNIDLLGFVATSELFWNQISVLIVPIAEGGGSNIKIAEAFINGKLVIAHPFASRGYEDFINSDYLILPKNNEEWIESINAIENPSAIQSQFLSSKANKLFDVENWNQILLNAVS
jgi:glycosyltransferase involved in cell wall biosynthesis